MKLTYQFKKMKIITTLCLFIYTIQIKLDIHTVSFLFSKEGLKQWLKIKLELDHSPILNSETT